MPKVSTVDWDKIRTAYVTGEMNLRELAKQFGVSQRQVFDHSRREGWPELREQYRSKTAAKSQEKISEIESTARALVAHAARRVLEKFLKALEDNGIELTPRDAEKWARVVLDMEQELAAELADTEIIIRWVTPRKDSESS